MLPNLKNTVISAIKNRRRLLIRYSGNKRSRLVEPHILYESENKHQILVCFQVGGYSSRGRKPPFWRPFRLKKVESVYVVDELFEPRVSKGFKTVEALTRGEIELSITIDHGEYNFFNSAVYGPPPPNYLEQQTTMYRTMERMAAVSS